MIFVMAARQYQSNILKLIKLAPLDRIINVATSDESNKLDVNVLLISNNTYAVNLDTSQPTVWLKSSIWRSKIEISKEYFRVRFQKVNIISRKFMISPYKRELCIL